MNQSVLDRQGVETVWGLFIFLSEIMSFDVFDIHFAVVQLNTHLFKLKRKVFSTKIEGNGHHDASSPMT